MADRDSKDLPRRTTADKLLCDKAFNNAKNTKYDGYRRKIAAMVYTFLIQILLVTLLKAKLCQTIN